MLTSKNIKTKAKHIIAESSNIIDKVRAGKIYKDTKEDRFSREYFKYYSSWIEQYFPGSDEMNMRCPSPNGKLFTYIKKLSEVTTNDIIFVEVQSYYNVYKLEHFLKINETDNILIDDKYLFDDFNFKYFVTSDNPRGPTIVAKRNNWDFVEKYFVEGMESSKDDWNRSKYVLKYKFERLNLDG
jgi:hypothetical protein